MPDFRQFVRFGYMPFMLLGLNCAAYFIVAGGHNYIWLAPLLIAAFACAHLAERSLPYFEEWNEPHGDEQATLIHNLVYETSNVSAVLTVPLIVWLFPYQGIWPTHWSILAQFLLAIAVADFAFTILHYLSHRWSLLWRLHSVHHGVGRLIGFNGLVRHPLHQSLDLWAGSAPLVILGMPVEIGVLLGFAISIQLIVQHSNVASAAGPFRNHLSIGSIHHLHHVNWGKEGDCNFGLFFTWWDRALGTFQPEPSRPITAADMGIDEVPDFPKSYMEQLMFPFRYTPGQGSPAAVPKRNNIDRSESPVSPHDAATRWTKPQVDGPRPV
ncbi:MAG: sterol desaturase family protein [Hyphomicrobium sp.]